MLQVHRLRVPTGGGAAHAELDAAAVRELEGVGQQVSEHLEQPLVVGAEAAGQAGLEDDLEGQALGVGEVPEVPLHGVPNGGVGLLPEVQSDGARLDLREVQDVADQGEELLAAGLDDVRELDLLVGEVPLGILAELLGEDQEAVQGCAQLVGHVGQEFALVLGGQGELLGLLLQ